MYNTFAVGTPIKMRRILSPLNKHCGWLASLAPRSAPEVWQLIRVSSFASGRNGDTEASDEEAGASPDGLESLERRDYRSWVEEALQGI